MRICSLYINWYMSRDSRQSSGSSLTMMIKTLSAIVACSGLLLVNGLDSTVSYANGTVDSSTRILDGDVVNPAHFPFIVQLYCDTEDTVKLCSGSVITHHFILTAAHCLFNKQCTAIQVFPSTWMPGDVSTIHPVRCYPHELFKYGKFNYDIGLLETREDLLVDGKMKPIPLPDPDVVYFPGVRGIILGWGMTDKGEYRERLMRANIVVSEWNDCNEKYRIANSCTDAMSCPVPNIPPHAMCTIGEAPKFPGSCWGDSGGPCIIDGELAGVMAGAIITLGKCETGNPSLLMNVADFVSWSHNIPQFSRDMNWVPVDGESF